MPLDMLEKLFALLAELGSLRRPHIRKHVVDRGVLLRLGESQCLHDFVFRLGTELILGVLSPPLVVQQQQAHAADGLQAFAGHSLHLLPAAIAGRVVGGAVVPSAIRHHLDHHRLTLLHAKFTGFLRRVVDRWKIVAVHADGVHAIRGASDRDAIARVLVLAGCRNRPTVIAAKEQALRLQRRGEIQRDCKIPLGGSTFPEVRSAAPALAADAESVARTDRLGHLRRKWRRHGLEIQGGVAVMHGHLTSLTRVGALAHALVNDLLDGKSPLHESAQFSVLRPEHVVESERCRRANTGSLLASARHVERNPALPLERVEDLVDDAHTNHIPVHVKGLFTGERQLDARLETAVFTKESQHWHRARSLREIHFRRKVGLGTKARESGVAPARANQRCCVA
mmetsp:Transcript_33339/g.91982  ORF Transcript_33339/g.91982 Transcript_33339/m.91982 type:complete len:397 (-) Transcript_33339:175-1365(-)